MFNYVNRAYIQGKDPLFAEALDDLATQIDTLRLHSNITPGGEISSPSPIASLTVTAAGGIFDAAIVDNVNPVNRGINYFIEYSTSPNFLSPIVIDLGSSRNWRGFLGNLTLYWRGYSQYPTSKKSEAVYMGGVQDPTPINGGGTTLGPNPQASSGSGTTRGSNPGDGGFGNQRQR